MHAFQGTRWTVGEEVPRAAGNHHPSIAPYGMFKCADGAVQMAVGSNHLWLRLCTTFGLDAADPRFATNDDRVRHRDELIDVIESVFASIPSELLLEHLPRVGIPASKIRSLDQVYEWDQVESQGLKISVAHARLGSVTLPGRAVRFFGPQGNETTRTQHGPPPVLDADGDALRQWLSMDRGHG